MATSALGLLASSYGDDDDEEDAAVPATSHAIVVNAAPTVTDAKPESHMLTQWNALKEDKVHAQQVMYQNPEYDAMWAPEQGPCLQPDPI